MSSIRINRIAEEIKKYLSSLVRTQLKDPRISPLTSVTDVEVSRDLSYAKIFISVLGTDKEKNETLKGLNNASGFIRKEVSKNIKLRHTPQLIFKMDESIEKGIYMSKLIKDVTKSENDE